YVLTATRSRATALLTWLAVLRILSFLAAEPGHPQEICVFLLVGLLVAALRPTPVRLALCGALLAALTLTKINLGVFASAGFVLAMANELRFTRGRRLLVGLLGAACAAGPILVMLPLIGEPWVRACCALILLSILLVATLIASQPSQGNLAWSDLR